MWCMEQKLAGVLSIIGALNTPTFVKGGSLQLFGDWAWNDPIEKHCRHDVLQTLLLANKVPSFNFVC